MQAIKAFLLVRDRVLSRECSSLGVGSDERGGGGAALWHTVLPPFSWSVIIDTVPSDTRCASAAIWDCRLEGGQLQKCTFNRNSLVINKAMKRRVGKWACS
jgi:hypothetical protein